MKMQIIYLILGLVLLASPTLAQSELDPYLSEAGKNNPELMTLFNEYLAALEKLPQAKALPDPQLAMAFFLQPVETRTGPQRMKLSLSQYFPWFGSLSMAEQEFAENAKAKLELFEEAKSRLFHEIRSSYTELVFMYQATVLLKENLSLLESLNRLVVLKLETGRATALDQIRLQIELGDLENQLAGLKDQIEAEWIRFDNLIHSEHSMRPDIPQNLDFVDIPYTKPEVMDVILTKNHSLLKTAYELASLSARKSRAELAAMPDFNLGLEYIAIGSRSLEQSGKDAWVFPKIGISIPLYRDKYKAQIQEAVYLGEAKNFQKENQVNQLENGLEQVFNTYRDAERRVNLYARQAQLAEQAVKLLETDFSNGSTPFEEVIRMEKKLLGYAIEWRKAQKDKALANSYIKYLMGS